MGGSIILGFICVLQDLFLRGLQKQFGSHSGKPATGRSFKINAFFASELNYEGTFLSLDELVLIWEDIASKKCKCFIHKGKVTLETSLNTTSDFWKEKNMQGNCEIDAFICDGLSSC